MKKLLGLLLVVTVLLSSFSVLGVQASVPTDDLVAYWSFDTITDGKVADLTGNGCDMTIDNTSYTEVSGKSGKTISFDTNSTYSSVGHMSGNAGKLVAELNGASTVTITGFLKVKKLADTNNNPAIRLLAYSGDKSNEALKVMVTSGGGDTTATGTNEKFQIAARSTYMDSFGGVNKNYAGIKYATKSTSGNASGWNAFAIVLDYANNQTSLYWDGVLATIQDLTQGAKVFSYTGTEGDILNLGSSLVMIDELKIYKTKLTDAQIKDAAGTAIEFDFEDACNGISDIANNGANAAATSVEAVDGVTGKAAKMDAANNLETSSAVVGVLRGAKAVTISTWLKLDTDESGNPIVPTANETVILNGLNSLGGSSLNLKVLNGGKISAGGRTVNGDGHGGLTSTSSLFANSPEEWHHVVAVMDYANKTGYIYIDGKLDKTQEWTGTVMTNGFLNCDIDTSGTKYDTIGAGGISMDSMKIYRRALTAEEVLELSKEMPFITNEFKMSGSTLTATVKVANQSGAEMAEGTTTAILAVYNKDRDTLVGAQPFAVPALKVGEKLTQDIEVENVAANLEGQYAKLFIWDDIDTMNPYMEAIPYNQD